MFLSIESGKITVILSAVNLPLIDEFHSKNLKEGIIRDLSSNISQNTTNQKLNSINTS